jgi:hypothetical protein
MLGDDRGQSIQIGAILLFGILVLGLAVAQTVVVPAENEGVEFNGYVETTEDLVTLQNDVLAAGTQGGEQAEAVKTGVRYPSRAVLVNPGPPVGRLGTTPPQNVTVSGAEVVSGAPTNARGFWSATGHNYSTRGVRFSPAYNNVDVPPIEVTGTGTYRLTDNGPLALSSGTFISGTRLTIVTVEGDLSTSSLSTSVAATPVSVATRSVTLRERTGAALTVTVPVPGNGTEAAAVAWNKSSAAASLRDTPAVEATAVNGSRVDVTLDGANTFELRLARVAVHDAGDSGVDTDTEPQYLVPLNENGTEVPTVGTRELSVEVRDRYNNPVGGADVAFTATGGSVDSATVTTAADGTATVAFEIADATDTATVTAAIDGAGVSPYNSTTVRLVRQGSGGDGGGINPAGGNDLALQSAELADAAGSPINNNKKADTVRVEFENFDTSASKNLTKVKLSFYSVDAQSGSRDAAPESATFDPVGSGPALTLDTGSDFENSSVVFGPGQTRAVVMTFYENQNGGGSAFEPQRGDFYVLSVFIDLDGDGAGDTTATYFIAPR